MQVNVELILHPRASSGQLQRFLDLPTAFDQALTSLFDTQPNELREEWQLTSSNFHQVIFQQRPILTYLETKAPKVCVTK